MSGEGVPVGFRISNFEFPRRRFPVTPAVIWAMGCQTLRQCLRRKVLLVLGFFIATLVVGVRVIPSHDPVRRLEALIVLCLYSISFFGIIVAIFLAATVLPEDRRAKTITTVMTKPVGRLNYLLGRVVGFAMTLGIILLGMGLVSWGFIRYAGVSAERAAGRPLLTAKRGIAPTEIYLREGKKTATLARWAPAATLTGSTEQKLVYGFRSQLDRLVGPEQRLDMTPNIATGAKLPHTDASVTVENPVTKETRTFDVVLDSERLTTVTFPASLIDPTEGVNVTVQRHEPGTYVRFAREAFELMTAPAPFEYSYFKSLLMIYFGFLLVIVISIAASTFLSSWVAVLVAFVAYFFSEFQQVLLDFMQSLQGEHAGFLGARAYEHVHGPVAAPVKDSLLVIALNKFFYGCMWVLTHVFPNFDRFDASDFLTSARDVPAQAVAAALVVFLGYGICYLALAHVVFHRRELTS